MDETAALETGQETRKSRTAPVASKLHTTIFLLILAGSAGLTYFSAGHMRSEAQPSRVVFYLSTLVWEWFLMAYVLFGVRRHGTPLLAVTGARWNKVKDVLRDIRAAMLFWIGSLLILVLVGRLVHSNGMGQNVRFMAPQGARETILWIVLASTAGICEETIFRGYLQKQFMAWTGSAAAGILLSAAIFGGAHIYQGFKATVVIGVYGLLFGILAYQRNSMRPGMIAHAWQDTVSGIALKFLQR